MATGHVTGMQEVNKTERFLVGQYKNRHIFSTDATFNLSDLLFPSLSARFKVTDLTDFCVFLLIIMQF